MSKNYKGIHYIQEQLKDFDKSFVNCVIRCFNLIEENKEPDGCLSNTTALYICAKSCGYNPIICYGLCKPHRWETPNSPAWAEKGKIWDAEHSPCPISCPHR